MSLDTAIAGLSPASYLSDLATTGTDTGSLGLTWSSGTIAFGEANLVPSETGTYSAKLGNLSSTVGYLKSSTSAQTWTAVSVYCVLKYHAIVGGSSGLLWSNQAAGTDTSYGRLQIDAGAGSISWYPNFSSANKLTATYTFVAGTTYEIGLSHTNGGTRSATIYINGTAIATGDPGVDLNNGTGEHYWMHAWGLGTGITGYIQRAAFWGSALSGANFTALHSEYLGESVTVDSPRCSKVAGYTSFVTWTSDGLSTVDVLLSTNDGTDYNITLGDDVTASDGQLAFWVSDDYISATCKIKVQGGSVSSESTSFAIVAASSAVLQPEVAQGAGSSAVSESGTGPDPRGKWCIVPSEEFTGVATFDVLALASSPISASSDLIPCGVEYVAVRADGGDWVKIPQPSLNSYRSSRATEWNARIAALGVTDVEFRDTQGFCFKIDADACTEGAVVLQAVVWPYRGTPLVLPDITVYADHGTLGHAEIWVDSVSGDDSNDGSESTPKETFDGAVDALKAASAISGAIVYCKAGTYRLQTSLAGAETNDRWLWVKPGSGVDIEDVVFEPVDVNGYLQVKKVRVSGTIDVTPRGITWGAAYGVSGGAIWLDDFIYQGSGYNSITLDADSFNNFTAKYFTDGMSYDCTTTVGGVNWYFIGDMIRNCLSYQCGGKQGGVPSCWQNFFVRDQKQEDYTGSTAFTADPDTDSITTTTSLVHLRDGIQPVVLSTTGTLPAPLAVETQYYVRWRGTPITLHATAADAQSGANVINITDAGSGTHSLVQYVDMHSDVIFVLTNGNEGGVICCCDWTGCYRPWAFADDCTLYGFAAVNCYTRTATGVVSNSGTTSALVDTVFLYVDIGENFVWNTDAVDSEDVHWHGSIIRRFDETVSASDCNFNYCHFTNGTAQGTDYTTGTKAYETGDRIPTLINGGLPLWPYDLDNVRRGTTSTGHETAIGPYAATAENTTAPTVTTTAASGVTSTSAVLGGTVTDPDGVAGESGIVFNLTGDPNCVDDAVNCTQIGDGAGDFAGTIQGLPVGTLIYFRAWVLYGETYIYGDVETFETLDVTVSPTALLLLDLV